MPTKILIVQPHNLSYKVPGSESEHPVTDISEQDVLSIVESILRDPNSVLMDNLPSDTSQINPAAVVIYEELKAQFDSLIQKKPALDARLDANFAAAEQYYSDENPKSDLLES